MIGLLIRHGTPDTALEHVSRLVAALKWAPLSAVYTSPLDRAVATAHPLAHDHGLDLQVRPALTDVDAQEPEDAARARIVNELMTLSRSHQGETIAIVTHTDPIRHLLSAFSDNDPAHTLALEIEPGHVAAVGITPGVHRVLSANVAATEMTV